MKFRFSALALAFMILVGGASTASAGPIVLLTFEGLQNLEGIGGFYNGGVGSLGSVGPNLGVEFVGGSLAIIDADAGGTGNIGGEPSPSTALFFLDATAVMNYAAGFDTGFSFYYSAVNSPGYIDVYSGLNKTGLLLAHLDLAVTPSLGGDPTGAFSPFYAIGVGFAGTAMSIDFGGTANQIAFDNVTFGSDTPGSVPEPGSTIVLLLSGLAGLKGLASLRRR